MIGDRTVDRSHPRISLFSMEKDARPEDKGNGQYRLLKRLKMNGLNVWNNKEGMRGGLN